MKQKYHFQAVDKDGRNMGGTILAESEEAARNKLSNSGFAVLNLEIYNPEHSDDEVAAEENSNPVFDFDAKTPEQKVVSGTIDGEDLYDAYKKLRTEYKFEILFLAPHGTPLAERLQLKEQGIDHSLEERFQEELKQSPSEKEAATEENVVENAKELEFVHKKLDEAMSSVSDLLQKNAKYLKPKKKKEIEERLNLLARLRQSNAVEHLQQLTERLLSDISDDALFLESENMSEEDLVAMEASKSEMIQFSKTFGDAMNKGLSELQSFLSNVDFAGVDVREQILHIHPLRKIASLCFFTSVVIFFLCGGTLGLAFFKQLFASSAWSAFYLGSGVLWYFFVLMLILSACFGLGLYSQVFSEAPQKITLASVGLALVLFVSLEFPVLIFWV